MQLWFIKIHQIVYNIIGRKGIPAFQSILMGVQHAQQGYDEHWADKLKYFYVYSFIIC